MNKICALIIAACLFAQQISVCNAKREVSRQKRTLIRRNSSMGLIIAIAVPIDLPKRSVYMSFNFEVNYGIPRTNTDIIPGILQRLELVRSFANGKLIEGNSFGNSSTSEQSGDKLRLSRGKIYNLLENKLTSYGFNGTQCLLRTICESAQTPIGGHNGILGDVFHIVFTPSSSKQENLDSSYYDAEANGKTEGCRGYKDYCPKNLFDYISKVM